MSLVDDVLKPRGKRGSRVSTSVRACCTVLPDVLMTPSQMDGESPLESRGVRIEEYDVEQLALSTVPC